MNDEDPPCPPPPTADIGSPATPAKKRYILVGVGPRLRNTVINELGAAILTSPTEYPMLSKNEMSLGSMGKMTFPGTISEPGSGLATGDGSGVLTEITDPTPDAASQPYWHSGVRGRLQRAAWRLRHPNWKSAMWVPPPEMQEFMLHDHCTPTGRYWSAPVTGRLRCNEENLIRPHLKGSHLFRYSTASIEYRLFMHYGGAQLIAEFESLVASGERLRQEIAKTCRAFDGFEKSHKKSLARIRYRMRYLREGLRRARQPRGRRIRR